MVDDVCPEAKPSKGSSDCRRGRSTRPSAVRASFCVTHELLVALLDADVARSDELLATLAADDELRARLADGPPA
jgi:hypothetical protein